MSDIGIDNRRSKSEATVPVWDPFVRIGHWTLVAAFVVAYLAEDEALNVHTWAGYVVGAYLILRVIWGFVGSPHARFSDFLFSPMKGFAYLIDLVRGRAPRYLGHSPAGAMMVFALLLSLAGTVATGTWELAASRGEGPLAPFVAQRAAQTELLADGEEITKHEESLAQEMHELFANLTLFLIAFHIAGVIVASVAHKESLVIAMINGRKRANANKSQT